MIQARPFACRSMRLFFAATALALAATALPINAQAWKPEKTVEIVAPAGPGSGFDSTARAIQKILQDKTLIGVPVSVLNKPGAGGAIAWAYINQYAGDGHYLALASGSLVANAITGSGTLKYTDVTPIAQLFSEYSAMATASSSRINTGADLIARVKADPASVTFGLATSLGGVSHAALGLVLHSAGVDVRKLRIAVFKSSPEAIAALLGGHIDAVISPIGLFVPHAQAGKLRIVGVTAPNRLGGYLAATPTWREQGFDAVLATWRNVVGPKGMQPQQVDYWSAVLEKLTATDEWKKSLEKNFWVNTYMNSVNTQKHLESENRVWRSILMELGLAR